MDVKFYIKRNTNNQVTKVTKSNILFLNEHFNSVINATELIGILRQIDEDNLGDFFQNSKYGKIPLSAKLVKKFTLCTLFEVECLSKDEFNALTPVEKKFEFIISQKTVSWILLLNKTEILGFLKFCNIHCEESSTLVQLRDLAKSAIKTFRGGLLDTEDRDSSNDSTADLTFTENKLSLDLYKSQKNHCEKNISEPDSQIELINKDTVETKDVAQQLKNLLIDIEQSLSPIKNTTQPNNFKFESLEQNQNNKVDASSEIINSNIHTELKTVHKLTSKNKMAGHQQFVPNIFNGSGDECVLEFFEYFNVVATANEWTPKIKLTYLPLYLKNSAYKLYKTLVINNPNPTFDEIERIFKEKFASPARNRMLKNKLRNKKLKTTETISEFLADILYLISQTNCTIPETEKIDIILEALTPEYYNTVTIMNNDTLDNLEINLKKIENSKLMNTDFQNISSVDIDTLKKENEFLKSKLNNINNGNRNFNQKKKFNNSMHVNSPSPYHNLQTNPNNTYNNNMCNYDPCNNNNNSYNNQNHNFSNYSFNPNNNFNNQMYNAHHSFMPNNNFNNQNYHPNNTFYPNNIYNANNEIRPNQYIDPNNHFDRKNTNNPPNHFNSNNGYTEPKWNNRYKNMPNQKSQSQQYYKNKVYNNNQGANFNEQNVGQNYQNPSHASNGNSQNNVDVNNVMNQHGIGQMSFNNTRNSNIYHNNQKNS